MVTYLLPLLFPHSFTHHPRILRQEWELSNTLTNEKYISELTQHVAKRVRDTEFVAPSLKKNRSTAAPIELLPAPAAETTPGRVYVFGTGDCAQLGLTEDVTSRKKPANLAALNDEEIVDIAAGGMHNMALTNDGKVRSIVTLR